MRPLFERGKLVRLNFVGLSSVTVDVPKLTFRTILAVCEGLATIATRQLTGSGSNWEALIKPAFASSSELSSFSSSGVLASSSDSFDFIPPLPPQSQPRRSSDFSRARAGTHGFHNRPCGG